MQLVTFTNPKGQQIVFGYAPPFFLGSIEGLGDVDADTQSSKSPYQDGATYTDSLLGIRSIPIRFTIKGNDYKEVSEYRKLMSSVFNPKLGEGALRYENENGVWEINCVADGLPSFPSGNARGQTYQEGTIELIAHDPYWKSVEQVSEPMTAYIGLFEFPLQFPAQMGETGTKQSFINEGDVPTPIQIEFKGPATNPKVENLTTGEYIKVNRELLEGETLIVDTTRGNKRVVITDGTTETNVLNWIDLGSTFFSLDVGINEIEYTADAGRDNAVVGITWSNRYLAV